MFGQSQLHSPRQFFFLVLFTFCLSLTKLGLVLKLVFGGVYTIELTEWQAARLPACLSVLSVCLGVLLPAFLASWSSYTELDLN